MILTSFQNSRLLVADEKCQAINNKTFNNKRCDENPKSPNQVFNIEAADNNYLKT